jgi:hypothetical protein
MQVQHFSLMLQSQSFRAICALNAGDVVTSRNIIQQCLCIYGFSYPPLSNTAPAVQARLRSDFSRLAKLLQSARRYGADGCVMPVADGQTEDNDELQPACELGGFGDNGVASGPSQQQEPASSHIQEPSRLGPEKHAFAGNSPGMCSRNAPNATQLDEGTSHATDSSGELHKELAAGGNAASCDGHELSSEQTVQVALESRLLDGSVDDTQTVSGSFQRLPSAGTNCALLQLDKNASDASECEQIAPGSLPAAAKSGWQKGGDLGASNGDGSRCYDAERPDAAANVPEASASIDDTMPAEDRAHALPSEAGPSGQGLTGVSGHKRARTRRLNGVDMKYEDVDQATDLQQFHETELLVRLQAHLMAHGLSIPKIMEMLRMRTMEIHMRV